MLVGLIILRRMLFWFNLVIVSEKKNPKLNLECLSK